MKRILLLIALLFCGCSQNDAEPTKARRDRCVVTDFDVVGDRFLFVQKVTIEGHEYLLFSSKLANPPTVVHSESCPCKEDEE